MPAPDSKLAELKAILKKMGSVVLAYSGGLDSTLLLKLCQDVLGDKLLAVTAVSEVFRREDASLAKLIARKLRVKHRVLKLSLLNNKLFRANPPWRCYFCKRELISNLLRIAKAGGYQFVVDGTNASDRRLWRPGRKAVKQFNVRSPLEAAGISKADVRRLSRKVNLPFWDRPPGVCLASRIPYGEKITKRRLSKIAAAEKILSGLGGAEFRVRDYGRLCRIEIKQRDLLWRLINKPGGVVKRLKKLGYDYITVDIEGYRSGSMDEPLGLSFRAGKPPTA